MTGKENLVESSSGKDVWRMAVSFSGRELPREVTKHTVLPMKHANQMMISRRQEQEHRAGIMVEIVSESMREKWFQCRNDIFRTFEYRND